MAPFCVKSNIIIVLSVRGHGTILRVRFGRTAYALVLKISI